MHLNLIYVYKLVLPFCCCVSSLLLPNKLSPKCTNLKQYMYIISHLLWARDRAWLHCVHSFQGLSWAAIKVWTGLCPFTVPVGRKIISNLMQLLSGPSSSQTVELKISLPHRCWLEAMLGSLSRWPLHHSSWLVNMFKLRGPRSLLAM